LTGSYTILHDALRAVASKYMKEDSYKKANDRLFVSITKVFRCSCKNEIINDFNSNDDIYDAVSASTHIPLITSLKLFYKFRKHKCIDGSFSNNWIKLKENTIIISPYKWTWWKRYTYAFTALISNSEKQFENLVKQGYEDAKKHDSEFMKFGLAKKKCL
jgi:hypothetical protein